MKKFEVKTKLPNRKFLAFFLTFFIILGITVGVGIYIGLDRYVPFVEGEGRASEHLYDLVRTTVAILGVITVGGAAAIQYRKQLFTEVSSELDRDTKHTALLTKAIEHLGDKNASVQKGGLYELKRLAIDSEKDCHDILEIIVGYISEHNDSEEPQVKAAVITALKVFRYLLKDEEIKQLLQKRKKVLNFADTKLNGRNFSGLEFYEVDFSRAKLNEAYFGGANLNGANLRRAKLIGAKLIEVKLIGADLKGADLREADLGGADLKGADLRWADLRWADLREASLLKTNLYEAHLNGADLRGATIEPEDIKNAHISKETKFDDDVWEGLIKLGIIRDDLPRYNP